MTGNHLAQEQCCIYQPRNWHPDVELAEQVDVREQINAAELVHLP